MEEVIRMLNEESRRKIRELKIDELVDILDDQEHRLDVYAPMSFDDRLSLAIDELYYRKNSKRAKRLISSAKLRYPDADINTLILEPRGLSKPRMIALAAESYLIDARNIIINGYTGVGKTYLSCAIAKEACRRLHKTRYVRMPKMLEEFNLSTQTGSGISKLVKRYSTYHLLIVDEWLVEIPLFFASTFSSKMQIEFLKVAWGISPLLHFLRRHSFGCRKGAVAGIQSLLVTDM